MLPAADPTALRRGGSAGEVSPHTTPPLQSGPGSSGGVCPARCSPSSLVSWICGLIAFIRGTGLLHPSGGWEWAPHIVLAWGASRDWCSFSDSAPLVPVSSWVLRRWVSTTDPATWALRWPGPGVCPPLPSLRQLVFRPGPRLQWASPVCPSRGLCPSQWEAGLVSLQQHCRLPASPLRLWVSLVPRLCSQPALLAHLMGCTRPGSVDVSGLMLAYPHSP